MFAFRCIYTNSSVESHDHFDIHLEVYRNLTKNDSDMIELVNWSLLTIPSLKLSIEKDEMSMYLTSNLFVEQLILVSKLSTCPKELWNIIFDGIRLQFKIHQQKKLDGYSIITNMAIFYSFITCLYDKDFAEINKITICKNESWLSDKKSHIRLISKVSTFLRKEFEQILVYDNKLTIKNLEKYAMHLEFKHLQLWDCLNTEEKIELKDFKPK